jgi:glycopeptide antibiotics resistance protein
MIELTYLHLFVGIAILACILIFLWKQKRDLWYLFFFAVFGTYLLFVLSVVIFPIVPLSAEHVETFKPRLNLIPFYVGRCDPMPVLCVESVVENILLTIPFGFGISFIAHLRSRDCLWLAPLVGFVFEIIQLIISFVFRSPFRATDINDVIFNAVGVWLGYGVFRIFARLYLYITQRFEMENRYLFAYIYDVVRQS